MPTTRSRLAEAECGRQAQHRGQCAKQKLARQCRRHAAGPAAPGTAARARRTRRPAAGRSPDQAGQQAGGGDRHAVHQPTEPVQPPRAGAACIAPSTRASSVPQTACSAASSSTAPSAMAVTPGRSAARAVSARPSPIAASPVCRTVPAATAVSSSARRMASSPPAIAPRRHRAAAVAGPTRRAARRRPGRTACAARRRARPAPWRRTAARRLGGGAVRVLEPAVQRHEPGQRAGSDERRPQASLRRARRPRLLRRARRRRVAGQRLDRPVRRPRSPRQPRRYPWHGADRPRPAPPGQGRPDRQERRRPVGIARLPRGRRAWQPRYRTVPAAKKAASGSSTSRNVAPGKPTGSVMAAAGSPSSRSSSARPAATPATAAAHQTMGRACCRHAAPMPPRPRRAAMAAVSSVRRGAFTGTEASRVIWSSGGVSGLPLATASSARCVWRVFVGRHAGIGKITICAWRRPGWCRGRLANLSQRTRRRRGRREAMF